MGEPLFDCPPNRNADPCARWDDLQGEARRDAVARTHNVVFSQLASIAFNMLECGVDSSRVHADVTRKCKESQLGEVQVWGTSIQYHGGAKHTGITLLPQEDSAACFLMSRCVSIA